MAQTFLLLTISFLTVLPCQAAGLFSDRFLVLESGIPGGWDGAGARGARPGLAAAVDLIQGAGPAKVSADMEDEGEEADEEFDPAEAVSEGSDIGAQGLGLMGDGKLSLFSPYWKERIDVVYRTPDGHYDEDALAKIRRIFRDKLTGSEIAIPIKLIELLDSIQDHFGVESVTLICGYRSPERNERMRRKSPGVAKNSLHIKGWAADIHVPGVALKKLHEYAVSLKSGGVGYYPSSGFVHVDVGRVRYW